MSSTVTTSRLDRVLGTVERIGNVLVMLLAVGVAERSGLLRAAISTISARRYEPDLRFGALIARMAVFVPVFGVVRVAALAIFHLTVADIGPGMPIHLST